MAMLLVPVQFGGTASAEGGVPGTLDPTFDTDGIAVNQLVSRLTDVSDTARQSDGKVLVLAGGNVWRFFADGTLDTSFDGDGVLKPASSSQFTGHRMAPRPDDPGDPDDGGFVLTSGAASTPACAPGFVAAFNADGTPDTSFDGDGVACINFAPFWLIADVTVQSDGQVVVLGSSLQAGQGAHIALVRLSTTGATVNTVSQPFSRADSSREIGEELAVQPDGKIVVAGSSLHCDPPPAPCNFSFVNVPLSRYNTAGGVLALDTTFGGGDGINLLTTALFESDGPVRLALRPDGQGMAVALAGDQFDADTGTFPSLEQINADANGTAVGSPIHVLSFTELNDLTATASGYVATGHNGDDIAAVALGYAFTPTLVANFPPPSGGEFSSFRGGSAVLLPDGKLLYVNRFEGALGEQLAFARLIENAAVSPRTVSLDTTLGESGFLIHPAGAADRGEAVATQSDGKVLVGGLSTTAETVGLATVGGRGFVLRHNDDGSLDDTFGGPQRDGVTFVDYEVGGVTTAPDDRVIVVGSRFFPSNGHPPHRVGIIQRLRDDGSPDPDWNGDGGATGFEPEANVLPGTYLRDAVVQPDSKVLAVGDHHSFTCSGCPQQNWIVVARFLADGKLDPDFGDNGFRLIGPVNDPNFNDSSELARGRGIALQPDGMIVVTGNLGTQLAVARLEPDGEPDPTFAAPGHPTFGSGVLVDDFFPNSDDDQSRGRDVALRPDGQIVVAGDLVVLDCSAGVACFTRNLAIAVQYLGDGKRDTAFNSDGLAPVASAPAIASEGRGVAVDGAGNVVVGGTVTRPDTGRDLYVARLTPTGDPDSGFGTNGLTSPTDVGQAVAGNGLALAPDGKIVIAGAATNTLGDRVVTARFEPGGALQCAPSPVEFGNIVLGTGAANQTLTCTNVGPSRLTITGITKAGTNADDFTPSPGDCVNTNTLNPGQSCQASVAFTPTAIGSRSATLGVAHTGQGPAGPISIGLVGTGIARDTTLRFDPPSLAFPEQLGLTTSPVRIVTVTNTGTVPVTINGVGIENDPAADFAVQASTCTGVTLAPGASCQVSVSITPKAAGARAASLRFDDTGAGAPHRLPLSGIGATPTVVVNPGLGRPGAITVATGAKFPPSQTATLTWVRPENLLGGPFPEPGLTLTTNPDGTFTMNVNVFPKSMIGARALLVTVGNFTANAPFLVTPGTLQGPDFIYRR